MWKFVHNGVDTHSIHFHLFNVQVINRSDQIGGVISPPDPNERGWKETVRMNPLEIVWVAMTPKLPTLLPFVHSRIAYGPLFRRCHGVIRPMGRVRLQPRGFPAGIPDPSFMNDGSVPGATPPIVRGINGMYDFQNEYVFHCHLLGHEENDMMRPMQVNP